MEEHEKGLEQKEDAHIDRRRTREMMEFSFQEGFDPVGGRGGTISIKIVLFFS